ncbi:phenylalanine 4-monooxygenase [Terrarubrum flagellatum]|uniref:phenylalanine 4-monooxygenase n=1 Tax=Terrirubrum flagellatum TaxID=2895980 RepID=UPI003144DD86
MAAVNLREAAMVAAVATSDEVRNRYANAPKKDDFTIDQDWGSYSAAEHDRWNRLFARQSKILEGRACDAFLAALKKLKLSESGIPDFEVLSDRLSALTGWSVVPVAGLVPDETFFDHLANRRFPAGAFIRSEREMDYLEEPDIFHDVFGHVPLLAEPTYATFLEEYGKGGARAMKLGQLHNLARLYWYTVEFGLMRTAQGRRIFGAGIMSSPAETVFSLKDDSPNRVAFNLERVMRTKYIIDDFQQTYFVIDSFEALVDECMRDFGDLYARLKAKPDIEAHEIVDGDKVLTRGSMRYFKARNKA